MAEKLARAAGAPLSAAGFILPSLAAGAHGYFIYSNYGPVTQHYKQTGEIAVNWTFTLLMSLGYAAAVWVSRRLLFDGKARDLKEAMVVYNIYVTALSAFMFALLFRESALSGRWQWTDLPSRAHGADMAFGLWVNYHSKFIEFMDTTFMLFRKKFSQISALHVAHHAEMPIIMAILNSGSPGGNSYFGPMINSAVHTAMYFYYLVTGLGFKQNWKMFLTLGQLVQFVVVFAQAAFCLCTGGAYWPVHISWVSVALMVQMFIMFSEFFAASYLGGGGGGKKGGLRADKGGASPASPVPS